MRTPDAIRSRQARRATAREGAAMLVVMLLLLIVTATATFAVQTTTTEIRSSGYQRQHMQTRHLAEGALVSGIAMAETQGPEATRISIQRSTSDALRGAAGPTRRLAPEEPPMAASQGNYRIELTSFTGASAAGLESPPVVTAGGTESGSFGPGMGYTPIFVVDVNDEHVFSGVVAGQRSDGLGALEYVSATYTARGAARVTGDRVSSRAATDDTSTTQDDWMRRGFHETVSTARAIGISGPTRRR